MNAQGFWRGLAIDTSVIRHHRDLGSIAYWPVRGPDAPTRLGFWVCCPWRCVCPRCVRASRTALTQNGVLFAACWPAPACPPGAVPYAN